jgi:hypothetical protein
MSDTSKGTFIRNHILMVAVGLMALYWFLEAATHVLVFNEASLTKAFFPTDLNELWMRGLICGLFLVFAFYIKSILRTLKRTQEFLAESDSKCRQLTEELRRAQEKLRHNSSADAANDLGKTQPRH